MALWGTSRTSDLQAKIDEIQHGLAALGDVVGDGARRAGKETSRGAHSAQSTLAEGAGDMMSSVGPLLTDLGRQIESLLSIVTAVTGGFARKAGKEGREAYHAVEERVEDNAMLAVLAAAGIGFLLGAAVVGAAAATRSAAAEPPARPLVSRRRASRAVG